MDTPRIEIRFALCAALLLCILSCSAPPDNNATAQEGFPLKTFERKTPYLTINASWPETGIPEADAWSEAEVQRAAREFEQWMAGTSEHERAVWAEFERFPFSLDILAGAGQPSKRVVSILWEIAVQTDGAHSNIELYAANYDRRTGARLELCELFADPGEAVRQFSRVARNQLALQGFSEDEWVRSGTEPEEEYFTVYVLTPQGIRLHFEPYQVGPWAGGSPCVEVNLTDLHSAEPRLQYWD